MTEPGDKADKAGKDTNFRGLTEFDNVVYYTKRSGSNGIDTVYFVNASGTPCTGGVGLPQPGAPLPSPGTTYQLCILKGFNTQLAKTDTNDFQFGLWFANPDTLYVGLNLGQPYTVARYPTGDNTGPGGSNEPWAPATDGLRNITGRVNRDGTVTIYATTSTVSGSGDQGGDPNKVVAVTDTLGADTLPASEAFHTVAPARFGVRYGGVAVLPRDFGR